MNFALRHRSLLFVCATLLVCFVRFHLSPTGVRGTSSAVRASPAGRSPTRIPAKELIECVIGPSLLIAVAEAARCHRLMHLANTTVVLMLASKNTRVDVIRAAWAFRVPRIHFVGVCDDCTVRTSAAHESWERLPQKVFEMFSTSIVQFPDAGMFVKVDSDTFLNYLNLLLALDERQQADGELPPYFGSVYSLASHPDLRYCSGGAGYALRRDAAAMLTSAPGSPYEDAAVGLRLQENGIQPLHHPGFIGDGLEATLKHWLSKPIFDNHAGDPTVPRYFISVHAYKDPWSLLAVSLLAQSSPMESALVSGYNLSSGSFPFVQAAEPIDSLPRLSPISIWGQKTD